MLALLLLLQLAQVPCVPFESSVVCDCKQGKAAACGVLRDTNPKKLQEIEEALRKAAVLQAARQEAAREQAKQEQASSEEQASSGAPEPPDCKGQLHHIISQPIAKALADHATLRGHYQPRDPRFVSRAVDEKAHCGYQEWHREVDAEVIDWLRTRRKATPAEFEAFLRQIYSRPELRARFPNGFY
jgi:hypothetical protein